MYGDEVSDVAGLPVGLGRGMSDPPRLRRSPGRVKITVRSSSPAWLSAGGGEGSGNRQASPGAKHVLRSSLGMRRTFRAAGLPSAAGPGDLSLAAIRAAAYRAGGRRLWRREAQAGAVRCPRDWLRVRARSAVLCVVVVDNNNNSGAFFLDLSPLYLRHISFARL